MGLYQRKNYPIDGNASTKNDASKKHLDSASQIPAPVRASWQNNSQNNVSAEYTAGDLIKLLHSLPQQNFDAEISAVIRTITSFDIDIQSLIDDISNQETLAQKRVKVLDLEIELFKAKIKNRKKELDLLKIGISELTKSKHLLQIGLKRTSPGNSVLAQPLAQSKSRQTTAEANRPADAKQSISMAEKMKVVASNEIKQINMQKKINSLRNKFKKRLMGI